MEWVQVYDPLGSPVLSTLVAAIPIVVLLGLLVCEVAAHSAALVGLLAALAVAIFGFGMPVGPCLASAFFALLRHVADRLDRPGRRVPISSHGAFRPVDVVKRSVVAISPDRRMQALLIAFSFGSFLEGAAGFGTPVAISAARSIGIGFSPLYAAGLALLANTSPVAFARWGRPHHAGQCIRDR